MDRDYLKKTSEQINEQEQEYVEQRYPSSQVYKGLGLTRDTLRYYEELGILSPVKNEENSYREYSINDIMNLLAIDFYKKRGITPKELKKVKAENRQEYYRQMFSDKRSEILETIRQQKRILKKLEETIEFMDLADREMNVLKIREFPLYEIEEEISSIANFKEYGEKVLNYVNISEDDIFSNMIKALIIDDNGYIGSKGYFVKLADRKQKGKRYLNHGSALYTAIEDLESGGEHLMEEMFVKCTAWANEHNVTFKGIVYLQPKCISWLGTEMRSYLECWIPIDYNNPN